MRPRASTAPRSVAAAGKSSIAARRPLLAVVAATAGLLLVAHSARAGSWPGTADPQAEIRAGVRALQKLDRAPAPELGRGFERWTMVGAGNDTAIGLWRPLGPRAAARRGDPPPRWTVVILGGIGTDDRAAALVPDSIPVDVLAMSWPWNGPLQMTPLQFTASAPAIRAALLRTPGVLARGVEAVRRVRPGSRVALVGASLGVPPAVAALPFVKADALVLVDGAADLGRLIRSEAARALGGGAGASGLAGVSAPLAAWLVSPLEPSRRSPAEREIPTLLVDAAREDRIPRECVAQLHARFPHATLATHPGGHMHPQDRPQMSSILATVWRWLGHVAAGPRVSAPRPARR